VIVDNDDLHGNDSKRIIQYLPEGKNRPNGFRQFRKKLFVVFKHQLHALTILLANSELGYTFEFASSK
jgi:hypothetical protein